MDTNPFESPQARSASVDRAAASPIELRPVLGRAMATLLGHPAVFAAIAGVSVVNSFANQSLASPEPGQFGGPQFLALLLSYVAIAWTMGSALGAAEGRPTSASLISPLPRIPMTLLSLFIYLIAVVLGSMLLVLPGIYIAVRFGFVTWLVVGGRTGLSAFGRSSRMVRGRWWNILGLILIGGLPFLGLGLLGAAAVGFDLEAMRTPHPLLNLVGAPCFAAQLAYFAVLFLEAERTSPQGD